jgi:nucleoside-diphosphate-sugar epimerase
MRIFVTGASGFIGQSVVLKLLEQGHHVIAAFNPSSQKEMLNPIGLQAQSNLYNLKLDILSKQALIPHLSDCECVVHLAYNFRDTVEKQLEFAIQSNQTILQACEECNVRKFIHISSISVYGDPPPSGLITEQSPRLASLKPYTSIKQTAEKIVLETKVSHTEVIVLQPSIVYGPGGGTAWTLSQMMKSFIPVARKGSGYSNPIHVDDISQAIISACKTPNIHKQCFIISNDQPISWRQFLSYYESILGHKTLIDLPIDYVCDNETNIPLLKQFFSRIYKSSIFRKGMSGVSKLIYGKSIQHINPDEFRAAVAQPHFSNQKARKLLNFEPQISLDAGMEGIRQWWNETHIPLFSRDKN